MHWIDPDCLPEISGEVERFILNVHSEVDGMVISDGKSSSLLIHTPPHMEADIDSTIQIGDTIGVRGVRPRGANMIAAVALIANGAWPSSIVVPMKGTRKNESARRRAVTPSRITSKPRAQCGCLYSDQRASCAAHYLITVRSSASVPERPRILRTFCVPTQGSQRAAMVFARSTAAWSQPKRSDLIAMR